MYSIVKREGRQGQIIHFLAESDRDMLFIIDDCEPGSTVEVLGETAEKKHKYIKSPSNKWVIYEGEADEEFVMPKNDAVVNVPDPKDLFPKGDKKVEEYQQGIKIYPTGLVTGQLSNNTVSDDLGYDDPKQRTGHFLLVNLETPKDATEYSIWTMGQNRKTSECDGFLVVRMENMTDDKEITIKYDSGEEFTFILDELKLK